MILDYGAFRTALDEAAALGNLAVVKILLEAGAKVSQKTLQIACSSGHLLIAQELVRANNHYPYNYNEILLSSIEFGHLEIIKYLVNELKADVNYVEESFLGKKKETITPLSLAIQHKQDAIVNFLKEVAKGDYKELQVGDKKAEEKTNSPNYTSKSRFFMANLNHQIQRNYLSSILTQYLDERSKKVDEKGRTKAYLHTFIPEFFQKSYQEKEAAVSTLTSALNGESVDLAAHLSTLRNGNLGNQLRKFIKDGHADVLVDSKVRTVREFVAALDAKVNPKKAYEV